MRLYLDTEFNGFGGPLMSLALVPAAKELPIFYRVVEGWADGPIDPFVQQHVIPNLCAPQMSRERAGSDLAAYLRNFNERPTVVADWPTDLEHLLALLINGPGMMHSAPDFDMEYRRLAGFNTAAHSRVPHNALEDAIALRNHCEAIRD